MPSKLCDRCLVNCVTDLAAIGALSKSIFWCIMLYKKHKLALSLCASRDGNYYVRPSDSS